jgi:hypothetical protein
MKKKKVKSNLVLMEQLLDVGKQQFTSYNFNTSNKLINKSVSKTAISQITLGSIADFTPILVQEQYQM